MVESKKTQVLFFVFLLVCALFMLRAVVVGCHHITLSDAIYTYHVECLREHREPLVAYADKEKFNETLFRWWDWSGKRILPEDKYRTIRPYIGQADSSEFLDQYFGG